MSTDLNGYPEPLEAVPAYLVNERERRRHARRSRLTFLGLTLVILLLVTYVLRVSASNNDLLRAAQQERICILTLQTEERRILFALSDALRQANEQLLVLGQQPVRPRLDLQDAPIVPLPGSGSLADSPPPGSAGDPPACVRVQQTPN